MAGSSFKAHKRKVASKHVGANKKLKTQHNRTDELPWKLVSRPFEAGVGGDDGILEFEEVDNVEVVYEETSGGKLVKFNVRPTTVFYAIQKVDLLTRCLKMLLKKILMIPKKFWMRATKHLVSRSLKMILTV